MRIVVCTVVVALALVTGPIARGQEKARTLVAVWAHADDEGPVAPVLARYAREGVQVHMIVATDGAQGAANTTVPRGPEMRSCGRRRPVVPPKRSGHPGDERSVERGNSTVADVAGGGRA